MLLLIDNYDSFAYNLARYLTRLGCEMQVVRNDALSVADIRQRPPQAIVLSPGPCTPDEAGCTVELVRQLHDQVPILGICLGHQTIVTALGGRIERSEPMHGRTSLVHHNQQGAFQGIPNPFRACRYHSLVAVRATLPSELQVTGETDDGIVMAVGHRNYPVIGLQFHPEAILTEHGYAILANFLRLSQIACREPLPDSKDELERNVTHQRVVPRSPITF